MEEAFNKSGEESNRPRNVFVLSTGRCGSKTFAKACTHISNFTSGHETRCTKLGDERLAYPDFHIEIDNRLAWFLGRIDEKYGNDAVYVHLYRAAEDVAESYNKRWTYPRMIVLAYARGILQSRLLGIDPCLDYIRTVTENINLFLKDKTQIFHIDISNPKVEFEQFWTHIGAEGDLQKALAEFDSRSNLSFLDLGPEKEAPQFEDSKEKIIYQLERIIAMFHKERDDLFKMRDDLKSAFNKQIKYKDREINTLRLKLDRERQTVEEQLDQERQTVEELKKRISVEQKSAQKYKNTIKRIRSSTTYRLRNVISKHTRTPLGLAKLPFAATGVGIMHFQKKLKLRKGPSPIPKRVVFEASLIEQKKTTKKAIKFLQLHGSDNDNNVSVLFYANKYIKNDTKWTQNVNSYLKQFQLAPLQLQQGKKPLFYRISSNPGYSLAEGPKVSVIMPAFNSETTIAHSISSILNQTWKNIELIIVDDASTDDTWQIIQSLATEDSRIKVLRNTVNVGPYVSKNRALMHATGTYITGHDADDWSHPQRIEQQLSPLLAEPGIKFSIAYMIRVTEQGQFTNFCVKGGKTSFDGAARLASISALFEAKTFKERLGHWDSIRFGADSELIERARKIFGPAFQATQTIAMICLDTPNSLTNHTTHGIRPHGGGLSEVRAKYRDSFSRWHATLSEEKAYIDFPEKHRKFAAPPEMLVDLSTIREVKNSPIE